jgi:hypothetical protein
MHNKEREDQENENLTREEREKAYSPPRFRLRFRVSEWLLTSISKEWVDDRSKEVVFNFGRRKVTSDFDRRIVKEGRWKIFDKEGERVSFGRWRESEFWSVMCCVLEALSHFCYVRENEKSIHPFLIFIKPKHSVCEKRYLYPLQQ